MAPGQGVGPRQDLIDKPRLNGFQLIQDPLSDRRLAAKTASNPDPARQTQTWRIALASQNWDKRGPETSLQEDD